MRKYGPEWSGRVVFLYLVRKENLISKKYSKKTATYREKRVENSKNRNTNISIHKKYVPNLAEQKAKNI